MLSVEGITVRYGSVAAVRDASLTVAEGELVGLVGPNGAGKSTTVKAILGLVPLASGRIRFRDEPLKGSPSDAGIAYVPESRRIFSGLSVEENLRIGATSCRRSAVGQRLEAMYARFPVLGERRHVGADQLSGGQQQMLAIARGLIAEPRLVVLDEPTLGLAPAIIDEIFAIVAELRAEGVTVLLVEQNTLRTLEVADRTYVMSPPGRIVFEGSQADIDRDPSLEARFLQLL